MAAGEEREVKKPLQSKETIEWKRKTWTESLVASFLLTVSSSKGSKMFPNSNFSETAPLKTQRKVLRNEQTDRLLSTRNVSAFQDLVPELTSSMRKNKLQTSALLSSP